MALRLGGEIDRVITAVRESRPVAVLGSPQSGSRAAAGTVGEETPLFLPSKIVDHDAKAEIQTKQSTGAAGGVDDATAALKKARGKRKKKEK